MINENISTWSKLEFGKKYILPNKDFVGHSVQGFNWGFLGIGATHYTSPNLNEKEYDDHY
jgi:hypothetical protein